MKPISRDATFQKLEAVPAYRLLADQITNMILSGKIKPGDQLPPEITLAEQFGVHRSTVREGFRLLEETGMLRRRSQKRLVVAVPDGAHLAVRSAQALVMRRIRVRDLYEANLSLDPIMAGMAAERATPAQLERLGDNLANMKKLQGDNVALSRLDAEFHSLVCEATNNVAFPLIRQPLQDLFMPMVSELIKTIDTSSRMIFAHKKIFDAIYSQDAATAKLWAHRHIADFKRGLIKAGLDFDATVSMCSQDA